MAHNSTHEVDHYEIGAGQRFEIGAGQRFEIGDRGPSISEDGFPQDVSLGAGDRLEIGYHDPHEGGQRFSDQERGSTVDIGAEETQAAVKQVIKTARDNRQPPPKMVAVPVEKPVEDDPVSEWFADVAYDTGVVIGASNPFPLMTKLLTRFGAGQEKPRYVRVDTVESYPGFIADQSPEMDEMRSHLVDLSDKLEQHIHDPNAHESPDREELLEAIDEAEMLGAAAQEAEAEKEIDLWLPEWAKGKIRAWKQGDFICASIYLPGADGEIRICTSMTPVVKAVEEMEHHAASANVSAAAIIGVLPAMGCVLGAGTLVKEMAAAAPSILQRPEAAEPKPFMCRIEPKANPAICSFVALLQMCASGDKQACAEWDALASAAGKGAPYAAQAMGEAKALFLKAKKAA